MIARTALARRTSMWLLPQRFSCTGSYGSAEPHLQAMTEQPSAHLTEPIGGWICLDPDTEEERLCGSSPRAALDTAEDATGAVRGKRIDSGLAQAEYHDYMSAGRPTNTAPDGRSWPPPLRS